jgi:hypothetical protein
LLLFFLVAHARLSLSFGIYGYFTMGRSGANSLLSLAIAFPEDFIEFKSPILELVFVRVLID